jgi:clan AA aspartic protease
MGEVKVDLKLENTVDWGMAKRGLLKQEEVRTIAVKAVVDTGAIILMLPEDQVQALGLEERRKAVVIYADERKESRPVAGTVTVHFGNRSMITECAVGPPGSEALLGQIPLEAMDLIVDCAQQKLTPRPESPYMPTLKLK